MTDAVSERYARFAEEAEERSPLYADWARGIAADPDMQQLLVRIPAPHRQPPVVFAVTRMHGAPLAPYPEWAGFVRAHADAIIADCAHRFLQTNEPLRLAALLPALSEVTGPLALLELGAAAGLCLYPDRYSYRYRAADGAPLRSLDPEGGPSAVILESTVHGPLPPLRMPRVVWRAGIDLAPLDARSAEDREWLRTLVWPGERARAERIVAALDIVASEPPLLVAGDAIERLPALAAAAPKEATLVISTPGVFAFLRREERRALREFLRSLDARWLTIDAPGLHDSWTPPVDPSAWPGSVVALDGAVKAAVDPLGRWWEWRGSPARGSDVR